MTPFFQVSWRSLAYQFIINAPLMCPLFSVFRKILHFQLCFGQNCSSQDAKFPNFHSQEPLFFKESPLTGPYFWKPMWHTPTKKVECPREWGIEGHKGTYQHICLHRSFSLLNTGHVQEWGSPRNTCSITTKYDTFKCVRSHFWKFSFFISFEKLSLQSFLFKILVQMVEPFGCKAKEFCILQ